MPAHGPAEPETDVAVGTADHRSQQSSWTVLAVIAGGGALGALARWGLLTAWPSTQPGAIPYPTLIANTVGGLLIGILMVLVTDVFPARRLIRPFLGVGVLGGFTTFSGYAVEIQQLAETDAPAHALGYLAGTMGAVLIATALGLWSTRLAIRAPAST